MIDGDRFGGAVSWTRHQLTAQRLAVLRAVTGHRHITAGAVAEAVRAEIGVISLQSAHDALGRLFPRIARPFREASTGLHAGPAEADVT